MATQNVQTKVKTAAQLARIMHGMSSTELMTRIDELEAELAELVALDVAHQANINLLIGENKNLTNRLDEKEQKIIDLQNEINDLKEKLEDLGKNKAVDVAIKFSINNAINTLQRSGDVVSGAITIPISQIMPSGNTIIGTIENICDIPRGIVNVPVGLHLIEQDWGSGSVTLTAFTFRIFPLGANQGRVSILPGSPNLLSTGGNLRGFGGWNAIGNLVIPVHFSV